MSRIEFGPEIAALQGKGIELAKAKDPNFDLARETLIQAEEIAGNQFESFRATVFAARNDNDLGVVDIREGLYNRSANQASNDEALEHVYEGIDKIEFSYESLLGVLTTLKHEATAGNDWKRWIKGVNGHLVATMNTWFRATQTSQLLCGDIKPDKSTSQDTLDAQWMIGDGTPDKPGAKVYARQGDNGYWAVQTHFLALRGARINGDRNQLLGAINNVVLEGTPEVVIRLLTDRKNAKQMIRTVGRLTLESRSRREAMAAALDYQRF